MAWCECLKASPDRSPDEVHAVRAKRAGFSLLEVIVVFAVIGILASVGALGYRSMISMNKVSSASTMIAANIRQARQFAVALRQSRRAVIQIERLDASGASTNPLIDRQNPPVRIWIEGKRDERQPFGTVTGARGNIVELSGSQALTHGVTIVSMYMPGSQGVLDPNDHLSGTVGRIYVEFNPRGQLQGLYFGSGSITEGSEYDGGQVFLHIMEWSEKIATEPDGEQAFYGGLIDGNRLSLLGRDSEFATERYKASTLEILSLTGKVREYDYGVGSPWSRERMKESEA